MTDEELAEIEEVISYSGESYLRYVVRKLIAEVRRQRAENRAMQSRLDIAEGRVEGMREENGSISVQRLRQLHKNAGGYYDTNFGT